jgi:hypothetical protein
MASSRLAPRDVELLAFIADHRAVLPIQLCALTGRRPETIRRRLQALGRAGLIRHEPLLTGHPAVRLVTPAGLRELGRARIRSGFKRREAVHDLGAGWLWLAARNGAFGPLRAIHTERTLRSQDGLPSARPTSPEPAGIRLFGIGPGGLESLHYPDLQLETAAGQRVALELELTGKRERDLETILGGYAADRRCDAVVYVVSDERVESRVRRIAARVGASEKLVVRRFTWSPEMHALAAGMGHPSVTRARTSGRTPAAPEAGR